MKRILGIVDGELKAGKAHLEKAKGVIDDLCYDDLYSKHYCDVRGSLAESFDNLNQALEYMFKHMEEEDWR